MNKISFDKKIMTEIRSKYLNSIGASIERDLLTIILLSILFYKRRGNSNTSDMITPEKMLLGSLTLYTKKLYEWAENEAENEETNKWVHELITQKIINDPDKICEYLSGILKETIKLDINYFLEHYPESINFLTYDMLLEKNEKGEIFQSPEISKLISLIAKFKDGSRVYNPFAGLGSYGVEMSNTNYFGEEIQDSISGITNIRFSMFDNFNGKVETEDSLKTLGSDVFNNSFDGIVSTPPIIPNHSKDVKSSIEYNLLINGMMKLKATGRMYVVLPLAILSSSGGYLFTVKKTLVENKWLEAIITLPSNLSVNTVIPWCIIVLSKNPNETIRLFDGSSFVFTNKGKKLNTLDYDTLYETWCIKNDIEGISCTVSSEKLYKMNYDLTPARYLVSLITNTIPENFESYEIKKYISRAISQKHNDEHGHCIKTIELAKGVKDCIKNANVFSEDKIGPNYCKYVQPVLVIATKFQKQYPTFCVASEECPIYMNPGYSAFVVNSDVISPEYLCYALNQEYSKDQIKSFMHGIVSSISVSDLFQVKILVPRAVDTSDLLSKQAIIVADYIKSGLLDIVKKNGLQNLIREEKNKYQSYVSYKKHRIRPFVGNLQSNLLLLINNAESNSGMLDLNNKIVYDYSVLDLINNMKYCFIELKSLVDSLTLDEYAEKGENLSIEKTLQEYINSRKLLYSSFKIEYEKSLNNKTFIYFSKEGFYEVFDSIINNAQMHGFEKDVEGQKVKITATLDRDDMVIFSIANNGKPMQEGFMKEIYFMKGGHDGPTGNTGIGGYREKELVEHFGGSVDLINNPILEYPVEVEIKLPLV